MQETLVRFLGQEDPLEKGYAAAAAKSLQSCQTLCDPIDGSPPGSPVPGILQARTLEWVAISFSNAWKWKVKVKSPSRAQLLAIPWTAAYQAPPPMGFSRPEHWSRVPLPSPREGICYPLQYSWASLVAQLIKNQPAMQETWVWSWVRKIPWRKERLPTPGFWPEELHGLYSPCSCKESDPTERLSLWYFNFF